MNSTTLPLCKNSKGRAGQEKKKNNNNIYIYKYKMRQITKLEKIILLV